MPRPGAIDIKTRLRIAGHVKRKMLEMEWSQADLVRELGTDSGTVSRMLSGNPRIGLDTVLKINRRLHIPANDLLNKDPD